MRKNILLSLDAWYPQISGPNVVVSNYKKYLEQNNRCKLLVPKYSKKLSAEDYAHADEKLAELLYGMRAQFRAQRGWRKRS